MAPFGARSRVTRRTALRSQIAVAAVAALAAVTHKEINSCFATAFPSPFRDIYTAGPEHGSVLAGVPFNHRRRTCTELSRCAMSAYSDRGADLVGPDPSVAGQLRALGRLLRSASERLVAAAAPASTAGAYLPSDFGELRVLSCGTAMQGTAEALLAERWREAQKCICDMPSQCNALLCKDDLKALQSVLAGWQPGNELRDALKAVGKKLEAATETADEALRDVLYDLAAAVHAGSRLFISRPAATRPVINDNQQTLRQQLERSLSQIPLEEQQAYLRQLVKRYHPDRNPGREMEVLPAFLHVQYLRNAYSKWN